MRKICFVIFLLFFLFAGVQAVAQGPPPPTVAMNMMVENGGFTSQSIWNDHGIGDVTFLERYGFEARVVAADVASLRRQFSGAGAAAAMSVDARTQMVGDYGVKEQVGNSIIDDTCCQSRAAGAHSGGTYLDGWESAAVTVSNGQVGYAVTVPELVGRIGVGYAERTVCVAENQEGEQTTETTYGRESVEVWPDAHVMDFNFTVEPNMDPRGLVVDGLKPLSDICPFPQDGAMGEDGEKEEIIEETNGNGSEDEEEEIPAVGFNVHGANSYNNGGEVGGLCGGCFQ